MKKIIFILFIASIIFLSGCEGIDKKTFEMYLDADDSTREIVGSEYLEYLEKDESIDPDKLQSRRDLLYSWEKRNQEAREGLDE